MAISFGWVNYQNNVFRVAGTTTNVGSTNAALTNGTFTTGDLLIAALVFQTTPGTITPPGGWTQFGTTQIPADASAFAWFWKTAGGAESGSYTFNWVNSVNSAWGLLDYTGLPTIDVSSVGTAVATPAVASSVSPMGSTDILITIFDNALDGNLFSGIPGNTRANVLQESGSFTFCALDQLLSASGPTGTVSVTFTNFKDVGWANIAIMSSANTGLTIIQTINLTTGHGP